MLQLFNSLGFGPSSGIGIRCSDAWVYALAACSTDSLESLLMQVFFLSYEIKESSVPLYCFQYSYAWSLSGDRERLKQLRKRVNVMPLGSGALAGNPFGINRRLLAQLLEFEDITPNSLLAVGDRDFVGMMFSLTLVALFYPLNSQFKSSVEFLSWASMLSSHLSRLAEDLYDVIAIDVS